MPFSYKNGVSLCMIDVAVVALHSLLASRHGAFHVHQPYTVSTCSRFSARFTCACALVAAAIATCEGPEYVDAEAQEILDARAAADAAARVKASRQTRAQCTWLHACQHCKRTVLHMCGHMQS